MKTDDNAPTYEQFYSRERPKAATGRGKDEYAILGGKRFTEEQLAEAERRAGDLSFAD